MAVPARIAACVLILIAFGRTESAEPAANGQLISTISADPNPRPFFSGPVPRSEFIAEDASLNDVCGVGQTCWAVGERGVITHSIDGGRTWTTRLLPADCSLTSV